MAQQQFPVLIVGGGIVGLSAALFLHHQGIASLLVERHPTTSILPRARGVSSRTMELYRELGLEERIRAAGRDLIEAKGWIQGETLAAALASNNRGLPAVPRGDWAAALRAIAAASPVERCMCPQDRLEPELLAAARERGCDVRFHTEMIDFRQDDDGVTATLRSRADGSEQTVRAAYLIAADGARSPIRERLGITASGRGALGHLLNIYFGADLSSWVRGHEFSGCVVNVGGRRGLLLALNNTDRWAFHLPYDPAAGETPDDFPPERCVEQVRAALGLGDLPIEIRSVGPWVSAVRVADSYRHGRIFFAGDAAHVMPPWGGQGANTGVQDAHNLAWKLAAVLRTQAGSALLGTYETERRPVGVAAAEWAGRMSGDDGLIRTGDALGGGGEEAPDLVRMLARMSGVPLGTYGDGAILTETSAEPPAGDLGLDGRPGSRAPHVAISLRGERRSTLNLFGRGFVLLSGPSGDTWSSATRAVAHSLNVPINAYCIGGAGDAADLEVRWPQAAGIAADGAILVRPDGFVAWRTQHAPDDLSGTLRAVMTRLLDREG